MEGCQARRATASAVLPEPTGRRATLPTLNSRTTTNSATTTTTTTNPDSPEIAAAVASSCPLSPMHYSVDSSSTHHRPRCRPCASSASTLSGPASLSPLPAVFDRDPLRFPPVLLSVGDWVRAQGMARPAPRNKRAFMKLAYRQRYKCSHCDELLHPDSQADHIVPWSLSGDDADGNIQILCPNCHAAKSQDEAARLRATRAVLMRLQEQRRGELEGVCWGCVGVRSVYFAECRACSGNE